MTVGTGRGKGLFEEICREAEIGAERNRRPAGAPGKPTGTMSPCQVKMFASSAWMLRKCFIPDFRMSSSSCMRDERRSDKEERGSPTDWHGAEDPSRRWRNWKNVSKFEIKEPILRESVENRHLLGGQNIMTDTEVAVVSSGRSHLRCRKQRSEKRIQSDRNHLDLLIQTNYNNLDFYPFLKTNSASFSSAGSS